MAPLVPVSQVTQKEKAEKDEIKKVSLRHSKVRALMDTLETLLDEPCSRTKIRAIGLLQPPSGATTILGTCRPEQERAAARPPPAVQGDVRPGANCACARSRAQDLATHSASHNQPPQHQRSDLLR